VIIDVPGDTPNTVVPLLVMVATPVLLLLHVPPVVALARTVVLPWQTFGVPEMIPGSGFTVTTLVT
jgi:hypothetical protein